jgi:hypothetical protein
VRDANKIKNKQHPFNQVCMCAIFDQQIGGNTRGVIIEALFACLIFFGFVTGHFHSSPNTIDLPMTLLLDTGSISAKLIQKAFMSY